MQDGERGGVRGLGLEVTKQCGADCPHVPVVREPRVDDNLVELDKVREIMMVVEHCDSLFRVYVEGKLAHVNVKLANGEESRKLTIADQIKNFVMPFGDAFPYNFKTKVITFRNHSNLEAVRL